MAAITCKFGGTSLADAACIRRVRAIIEANPARRFIVPSAPGKRTPDDIKITDLLYNWHNLARLGLDVSQPADLIRHRFQELAAELGLKFDVQGQLDEIAHRAPTETTPDYMASRGEYLNGRLMAELLDAVFVDPADYILFDPEGALDPATYARLADVLREETTCVIPGFYGAMPDGRIKTFSRGGSDVTGAIVAHASTSELYENWTDVNGFLMADPRMVPHAKHIDEITYEELRELAYMGAKVLHDEAIFPVRISGVPINIRNTWEPEHPGTMILPRRETTQTVCGIAGQPGFIMINIEKALMNKERGFARRVLSVLEEHGISFEHMPSSIDTISVIVREDELGTHGQSVLRGIERNCEPDRVTLVPGLAMIATVGQGMTGKVGVAARLCTALANVGVNIRVIDQGSSENNIIIGVRETDLTKAVRAIYDAFADE